jgi:aminomuconate-semialdehyde/2-hydroxymuconate-6-semialdehyde dehydrogenase
VPALVERARALRIGDPLDPATEFGSLISAPHLLRVAGMVDAAVKSGARALCGGVRISPDALPDRVRDGAFYPPTLLQDAPPDATANQEEIFGPVATLIPFSSDTDATRIANGTKYGLSATVWTRDNDRAARLASALTVGTVWINGWMMRDLRVPIGGFRCSGIGREGGLDALHFFAEPTVIVRTTGG